MTHAHRSLSDAPLTIDQQRANCDLTASVKTNSFRFADISSAAAVTAPALAPLPPLSSLLAPKLLLLPTAMPPAPPVGTANPSSAARSGSDVLSPSSDTDLSPPPAVAAAAASNSFARLPYSRADAELAESGSSTAGKRQPFALPNRAPHMTPSPPAQGSTPPLPATATSAAARFVTTATFDADPYMLSSSKSNAVPSLLLSSPAANGGGSLNALSPTLLSANFATATTLAPSAPGPNPAASTATSISIAASGGTASALYSSTSIGALPPTFGSPPPVTTHSAPNAFASPASFGRAADATAAVTTSAASVITPAIPIPSHLRSPGRQAMMMQYHASVLSPVLSLTTGSPPFGRAAAAGAGFGLTASTAAAASSAVHGSSSLRSTPVFSSLPPTAPPLPSMQAHSLLPQSDGSARLPSKTATVKKEATAAAAAASVLAVTIAAATAAASTIVRATGQSPPKLNSRVRVPKPRIKSETKTAAVRSAAAASLPAVASMASVVRGKRKASPKSAAVDAATSTDTATGVDSPAKPAATQLAASRTRRKSVTRRPPPVSSSDTSDSASGPSSGESDDEDAPARRARARAVEAAIGGGAHAGSAARRRRTADDDDADFENDSNADDDSDSLSDGDDDDDDFSPSGDERKRKSGGPTDADYCGDDDDDDAFGDGPNRKRRKVRARAPPSAAGGGGGGGGGSGSAFGPGELNDSDIAVDHITGSCCCPWKSCGKAFPKPSALKRHYRTHSGERPFQCTWGECTRSFAERGNLKRHMRVHTGEKPYKCQMCSANFARMAHLQQHEKSRHRSSSNRSAARSGRAAPAAAADSAASASAVGPTAAATGESDSKPNRARRTSHRRDATAAASSQEVSQD